MKKNRFPKHVFMNAKMQASNHNEFFFIYWHLMLASQKMVWGLLFKTIDI